MWVGARGKHGTHNPPTLANERNPGTPRKPQLAPHARPATALAWPFAFPGSDRSLSALVSSTRGLASAMGRPGGGLRAPGPRPPCGAFQRCFPARAAEIRIAFVCEGGWVSHTALPKGTYPPTSRFLVGLV